MSSIREVDAVSVVWPSEPPGIITPPLPASALAGGSASFVVVARGAPPLRHQWLFDDVPLPGETNRSLLIEGATPAQAGQYSVVITNSFGSVTSPAVSLTVEAPQSPASVLQPYGERVALNGYHVLTVVAIGTEPLSYQWERGGVVLPEETNRHLVFPSVQLDQAGSYTVTVSNGFGAVVSLPATLQVDDSFAQLYGGPTVETLRPAGAPVPFRAGPAAAAGLITAVSVALPTVPPGTVGQVQMRAWDSAGGMTYEEARARGFRFGKSLILPIVPIPWPNVGTHMNGLQSFALSAGLPRFEVGVLSLAEQHADGTRVWSLRGEPGFQYLIERATNNFSWRPLMIVTNLTGTVSFIDRSTASGDAYYRSRILD